MTFKTLAAGTLIVLAVAACGSSAATSAATSAPSAPSAPSAAQASDAGNPAPAANAIAITERDFKFDTPEVTATGTQVSLAVTNAGPTVHDLTVRDAAGRILGETEDLKAGASETLTIQLPAGSYTIFCSLPGHESLGLKGTLTVTK
jgi:plastocyanin